LPCHLLEGELSIGAFLDDRRDTATLIFLIAPFNLRLFSLTVEIGSIFLVLLILPDSRGVTPVQSLDISGFFGVVTPQAAVFPGFDATSDHLKNARTAGVCGLCGGRLRPLGFILLFLSSPVNRPNGAEIAEWGWDLARPVPGAHSGAQCVVGTVLRLPV
jgi:hypothetical protein